MSADRTGISWCDSTWGPIRGCSRVSEGCRHCYAERQALRITRMDRGAGKPEGQGAYDGLVREVGGEARWTGQVRLVPELLDQPLRWKRRRRIFVNSMSDLFHESLPFEAIAVVFGVMAAAQQHVFQCLTKRPGRMREFFEWLPGHYAGPRRVPDFTPPGLADRIAEAPAVAWPLSNVWLGVSAEDQATLDARVPDLLRCPAAVRWLSLEPQLGSVDLRPWLPFTDPAHQHGLLGTGRPEDNLQWVVQGGESGPGARPFDLAWARSVRDQCKAAGVAYYLKQLGANPMRVLRAGEELSLFKMKHRSCADPAEWPEDLRVQEFPEPRR